MPDDPLRTIEHRHRRDITTLYATLGDAIENAVARSTTPGEPITHADRVAIMREVDDALDVIYGTHRGDEDTAIRQMVLRDTRAARLHPLDAAVKQWRRAMTATLRAQVEADAQGETM